MTDTQLAQVLAAMKRIRMVAASSEFDIHARIAEELGSDAIEHEREVKIGPRMRIDFLAAGDIGIEVKKGKPTSAAVIAQAERYLSSDRLSALVLVVERSMQGAPLELQGKPVRYIALNKNWGIAL